MELSAAQFTFLRPLWLLGLLLLPLIWWLWRHRRGQRGAWQAAVDAHLLPHLLQQVEVRGGQRSSFVSLLAGLIAIIALAGPSWQQRAAPLWQKEAPLVIALDLSAAMRAADLPPSRLVQVRAKLGRLLKERRSGQVGLLAYAGDAFTVAPITRDGRTVSALLESLDPDVMPVEGQRSDRAIKLALKMLADSDASSGEILLVTDHGDTDGNFAAVQARTAGVAVSVLGVGTLAGAPLTGKNGFITGADGQPRLARLDPASLNALAAAGGGRYTALSVDDSDLATLGVLDPAGRAGSATAGAASDAGGSRDDVGVTRSDDGYWLLLALLPLVLFGFRRGWLAALPLVLSLSLMLPGEQVLASVPGTEAVPQAQQAPDSEAKIAASEPESGFSWDALWQRADQRAHAALQAGDAERARQLAPDPALQGAAAFRGDDYTAAAQAWAQGDDVDSHYNRGNALAKAGKLEEALRAYDEALAREPDMADALANRKAVEDFLKQQQQQQQQSKDQKQGEQKQGDQQQGEQQQGEQKQGEQKQGEQQQGEQQKGEQQQGEQKQGDQQQGEQKQGEQSQGEQKQGEQQQGEQQQGEQQQGEQQQGEQQQGEQQQGEQQQGELQQGEQEQGNEKDAATPDRSDGKDQDDATEPAKAATAAEQAQQRAAEQAAREQMQQALDAAEKSESGEAIQKRVLTAEERQQAEQQQATEQLLRRVPDDPGALLRRKFEMEYRRRLAEGEDR